MRNKNDKDEPGFPFFRQSWIYTADRQALMLPEPVIRKVQDEAIARREAEEEEERRKAADETDAVTDEEPVEDGSSSKEESLEESRVMHRVFDQPTVDEIAAVGERGDRERRPQIKRWCELMRRDEGRRQVVQFPERLTDLRAQFPNFRRAVDVIEALCALHRFSNGDRQAESLLLCGPPGIGKTVFVEAVARAAGVELGIVSLGSTQGNFELVGTSSHYSNAEPGRVWRLLAAGSCANAVLMLDELDKAAGDQRYNTTAALLDLLERRASMRFVDQAVGVEMDTSLVWKIATANTLKDISAPILSRMHVIEIDPPTDEQLRAIYVSQYRSLVKGMPRAPLLSRSLVRHLVMHRPSPRVTDRVLRVSLGLALRDRRSAIRSIELDMNPENVQGRLRPIGFVQPRS